MITVGQLLKSRRNSKEISLEEISQELKISIYTLEQIENDQVTNNADIIFYIGHLRSYSNFLELDSRQLINDFKNQISFSKKNVVDKIPKPRFENKLINFQKSFSIGLIVVIFTSFYFLFLQNKKNTVEFALTPDLPEIYVPIIEEADLNNITKVLEDDNVTNSKDEIKFNNSSVSASIKSNNINFEDTITIKLLNPTWVQLRDSDNNIIISKLMEKNEEYSYKIGLQYNITAGNAGNILVLVNDQVRGKVGKYGDIVDSIILDHNFKN